MAPAKLAPLSSICAAAAACMLLCPLHDVTPYHFACALTRENPETRSSSTSLAGTSIGELSALEANAQPHERSVHGCVILKPARAVPILEVLVQGSIAEKEVCVIFSEQAEAIAK